MKKLVMFAFANAALLFALESSRADHLLHYWGFVPGIELADPFGGLHLRTAPGEGGVTTDDNGTPDDTSDDTIVMGTAGDIAFEPGFGGNGLAYRPFYVDPTMSSTAGAGLTGSNFTSPNQFTIEAVVKADAKTSGSAVNYIFQTRPGSDRGYYLIQDEDNLGRTSVGGLGSIIGNNFGDVGIGQEYGADETWLYIAAAIDLASNPGQAVADIYAADLTAGDTSPTLIAAGRTWNSADPSTLAGATGIFGIGNFAIDRGGDGVAEASQEWFQGAIDYVAIYDGVLGSSDLQDNLDTFFAGGPAIVPEPTSAVLALAAGLALAVRRRK